MFCTHFGFHNWSDLIIGSRVHCTPSMVIQKIKVPKVRQLYCCLPRFEKRSLFPVRSYFRAFTVVQLPRAGAGWNSTYFRCSTVRFGVLPIGRDRLLRPNTSYRTLSAKKSIIDRLWLPGTHETGNGSTSFRLCHI